MDGCTEPMLAGRICQKALSPLPWSIRLQPVARGMVLTLCLEAFAGSGGPSASGPAHTDKRPIPASRELMSKLDKEVKKGTEQRTRGCAQGPSAGKGQR